MDHSLRITENSMLLALAALTLAGCASGPPPVTQTAQSLPLGGAQMTLAVVASVRHISVSGEQPGSQTGVNAVLTALNQPPLAPPISGEEIVLHKDDGNTAALAVPTQTQNLAVGERVAVVSGPPPAIIRRN